MSPGVAHEGRRPTPPRTTAAAVVAVAGGGGLWKEAGARDGRGVGRLGGGGGGARDERDARDKGATAVGAAQGPSMPGTCGDLCQVAGDLVEATAGSKTTPLLSGAGGVAERCACSCQFITDKASPSSLLLLLSTSRGLFTRFACTLDGRSNASSSSRMGAGGRTPSMCYGGGGGGAACSRRLQPERPFSFSK